MPVGRRRDAAFTLALLGVAGGVTGMVLVVAWVCDDAFITFRYVANVLAGHGAVFNLGERVQGYTHPLWFLVLCVGTSIGRNPMLVALGLGAVLTLLTVMQLGAALRGIGLQRASALLATSLAGVVLASSHGWRTFQTGGLENALAHALLVAILATVFTQPPRLPRIAILSALLVMTRLDFALLVAPLAMTMRPRTGRAVRDALLGVSPLLLWLVCSWLYYGDPLPNTAHAKLGVYPSWRAAVAQGWTYVVDWLAYEPAAVILAGLLYVAGVCIVRDAAPRACAAGVALYVAYVIGVGGDFMRARLLLPAFVGGTVFGILALARRVRSPLPWLVLIALAGAIVVGGNRIAAPPSAEILANGIVDEWRFYPGFHLDAYRRRGRLTYPFMNEELAAALQRYAARCGGVTVHTRNPATLGYLAGPDVEIIDTLGLTDRFIAALPTSYVVSPHPRPGHADKRIPLSYLARRGDIAIIRGWRAAVLQLDCAFRTRPQRYVDSTELYTGTLLP